MIKQKWIIGIDPDVDKSGIADCACYENGAICCSAYSLTFDELINRFADILEHKRKADERGDMEMLPVEVIIEAGWMNQKASWHTSPYERPNVAAKKGLAVGRNHQVAHDIASLCKAMKIPYREVAPLRKTWSGKDGKITEDELLYFCPMEKRKDGHTHNQEERDAMLLAWVYAGGAVRVKPINSRRK